MDSSSVLLIDERVLPDQKELGEKGVQSTSEMSLVMISMFNSFERTETQWRKLLSEAGCKVKEIRKYTGVHDCVIVAVKK
jgi:demethylsterigmatocystin 6-O-methyltransferase